MEEGCLHMVFSVTNRLRPVWKIFIVDVRGAENEEGQEVSGVDIVDERREEIVEGGRLHLVTSM